MTEFDPTHNEVVRLRSPKFIRIVFRSEQDAMRGLLDRIQEEYCSILTEFDPTHNEAVHLRSPKFIRIVFRSEQDAMRGAQGENYETYLKYFELFSSAVQRSSAPA
ncbi:MAG: hypothetical protein GX801_02130 [Fibrobacter sp.]|nr:hypothetical protein [Fibrobacter sp.]